MSEYGKLVLENDLEESDVENGLRDNYNVQSPRVIVPEKGRYNYCFGFSLFVAIIGVCTLISTAVYKEYQMITNTTLPDPERVSASGGAWPHHGLSHQPHHYHCSDGGFDCCYIYSTRTYKISPQNVVGRDVSGSNCPSLVTLINKYNDYIDEYFTPKNCSEVECCKIDASRDLSIRYNKTVTGNLYEIKEKICPTISQLIHKYELGYPDPKENYIVLGSILAAVLCLIKNCPD